MTQRWGVKPRCLTLLLIAGLILPSHSAISQVKVTHLGFLSCYRRAQDLVMRNEAISEHLLELEKQRIAPPVQPDTPGWLFSSEQLDPKIYRRIERILVAACLEAYPLARTELKSAPDFRPLLREVFAVELNLRREGFTVTVLEMVILSALMNQDSQLADHLGPLLFHETRAAFIRRLEELPLPPDEIQTYRSILTTPLNLLRFTSGTPFAKFSATVRGQHDLHVHLRKFDPRQFATMVIHESCHLNPRAAALRLKNWEDITEAEWVFLTLQEEFRATYLTAKLEDTWYNCSTALLCDRGALPSHLMRLDPLSIFEDFASRLYFVHPKQERAVTAELAAFRTRRQSAQLAQLLEWIVWP